MKLSWYARRLSRMAPAEIAARVRDQFAKESWRSRHVRDAAAHPLVPPKSLSAFVAPLPPLDQKSLPLRARDRVVEAAEALLQGDWRIFDRVRSDMVPVPDWFLDPRSGRRAPNDLYAFDIDHRDENKVGNIKYVWELSRHHHLTLMATAFYVSRDGRYAECVAQHLRSWWRENPFLSGVHWISGIELGLRLIAWIWVRRLLDDWRLSPNLFEGNAVFLQQLHHHQEFLATFQSHGSSANNHLLAEAAALFASACAFPYFRESADWRAQAARVLKREIPRQTFSDGLNRELATAYHGFVLELCLVAALEGEAVGQSLGREVWSRIQSMADALAAILDARGQAPRQGDSDDGIVLLLDHPDDRKSASLLSTAEVLFGACSWWPRFAREDLRTPLWTALTKPRGALGDRPKCRPCIFPEAGMVLLRDRCGESDEIWCRCDHGPHGYLSTAAHAHADALSIEVRYGGIDILADPGTYCYYGDPEWRAYFRSTLGHNTLSLDGTDQSISGGPFLWLTHARSDLISVGGLDDGPVAEWMASHRGYERLRPSAVHQRRVRLERAARRLVVEDVIESDGDHACKLAFHLGPAVQCRLKGSIAHLAWQMDGQAVGAVLTLPRQLDWTSAYGEEHPPRGWYSPAFNEKVPSVSLIGSGTAPRNQSLETILRFEPPVS